MPGSAGGHSGGFSGGGHSGGFSGGGHSGSFGGGSHNVGGFTGGSRPSHQSGGFHPYGGMGGGFFPHHTGGGRNRRGGGCLSGALLIILAPIAVIFFAFFAVSNFFTGNSGYTSRPDYYYEESVEVISELVTYEKLSDYLCAPIENCVETDITGVLDDEGMAQIQESIDYFYETTGVQPYFILLGGIDGSSDPDYDTVDSYLYNKYVEMFPDDEGHIIILMLLNGYDYTTWYIIGDDAYYVTDEYACETILNNIDYYAAYSTDIPSVISDAFTDSANDIMTDIEYEYIYPDIDPNNNFNYDFNYEGTPVRSVISGISGIAVLAIFVIGIVVAVRYIKKSKKSNTGSSYQKTAEPGTNPYRQVNSENTSAGSFNSASHTPNKAAYPVRCPSCGATAYPKDDGTCEYCGSKLPE